MKPGECELRHDRSGLARLIVHSVGHTLVAAASIWGSEQHFDRFGEQRLGRALMAAGIDMSKPPDIEEFTVKHIMMRTRAAATR